ncbi:glycosyltransferase family 9 protein [Magnetococcales bacterium HHB-1]
MSLSPDATDFPARVLLIRLTALGDLIECTRFVRGLKLIWPQAQLELLTSPMGGELFSDSPYFTQIHLWDRHGSMWQKLKQMKTLKQQRWPVIFDLHSNRVTGLLMQQLEAEKKVRVGRGPLFQTLFKNLPLLPKPTPYSLRHMVEKSGFKLSNRQERILHDLKPALPVSYDARLKSEVYLRKQGWDGEKSVILLAPGSSAQWPSKRWPIESFIALSHALIERGMQPVFVGSTDEKKLLDSVRESLNNAVLDLMGETSLSELAALSTLARWSITNDSGPMHVAAAVGTPTIALFGATDFQRHGPQTLYGEQHHALSARLDCSPCHEKICPLSTLACMDKISVEQVLRVMF